MRAASSNPKFYNIRVDDVKVVLHVFHTMVRRLRTDTAWGEVRRVPIFMHAITLILKFVPTKLDLICLSFN